VDKKVEIFLMSFILNTPQFPGLNAIPKITWGSFRGQRGKKRRDHFGVDFGHHFGVGDHFVVGILSGAVQIAFKG